MGKLVTLAYFNNAFDVKYNLLKGMLEEAGIPFVTTNDKFRSVKTLPFMSPANISIDIKVDEENLDEALSLYRSIR